MLYARVLARGLGSDAPAERRAALVRWVVLTAAWQLLVVVLAGIFVLARARAHDRGLAWVAPPVAAIIGNAISAQLGAGRIAREALR